ncbi:MAG: PRC-barrel domain-containing protein [Methanomassiliicoccaceae archaeon]|jgi:sporulation protein YlmC with PRC-barrel domain|nr:PRC-barrel domain-containing protein [Methanomassiliicoccaceae archaeon]
MMENRVFISEIAGKMAVSKDGQLLGPIEDVVIDTSSGLVRYLILGATTKVSDTVDDMGRAIIPIKKMHLDQEYVIVTPLDP